MKNLTVFYMEGCPYCRNARRALEELIAEKPAYKGIPVEWVDENKHPERTEGRDYYYVPTFFPEKRNCMRRIRGMIMLLYTSRSRKHWNML